MTHRKIITDLTSGGRTKIYVIFDNSGRYIAAFRTWDLADTFIERNAKIGEWRTVPEWLYNR